MGDAEPWWAVAIPSNRVNVSYQSPQIGSMFPDLVAIPSNRVNVSYFEELPDKKEMERRARSQSPQIGSMFLTGYQKSKKDVMGR